VATKSTGGYGRHAYGDAATYARERHGRNGNNGRYVFSSLFSTWACLQFRRRASRVIMRASAAAYLSPAGFVFPCLLASAYLRFAHLAYIDICNVI